MAYKKYIKKNGKIYGPYVYHSRRVNGKVVSEYYGHSNKKNSSIIKQKKSLFLAIIGFLSLVLLTFLLFNLNLTGNATLSISDSYAKGGHIEGSMNLFLDKGEFIPASTKVMIDFGNDSYAYSLSDLVPEKAINSNFHINNKNISGNGEGYGFLSSEINPKISFVLEIYDKEEILQTKNSVGGSGDSNSLEKETFISRNESENLSEQEQVKEKETKVNETNVQEPQTTEISSEKTSKTENQETQETSQEASKEILETKESKKTTEKTAEVTNSLGETTEGTSQEVNKEEKSQTDNSKQETKTESKPKEKKESKKSPVEEVISNFFLAMTGRASLNLKDEIQAEVSKDKPFTYNISDKETAKIKPNSVMVNGEIIQDNKIKLKIKNNQITVTTSYSGDKDNKKEIKVNLGKLNIPAKEGKFKIKLVYEDIELVSAKENIKLEKKEKAVNETSALTENATAINKNVTLTNQTQLNETLANITEANITIINKTIINQTLSNITIGNLTIETILQNQIVVGKPVKWKKRINLNNKTIENISVELPKEAQNISVFKLKENSTSISEDSNNTLESTESTIIQTENQASDEEANISENIENPSEKNKQNKQKSQKEIKEIKEEVKKENIKITAKVISGNIYAELDIQNNNEKSLIMDFFKDFFKKLTGTGKVVDVKDTGNVLEVTIKGNISENITAYELEYETPGPQAFEYNTSYGKEITISTATELNYTNILAYTYLPKELNSKQIQSIRLYHYENGTRISTNFQSYDTNNNSLIDYIEWNVPHLSNQTYDLVIEITKAEHLDENRTFISDIYNEVKALDGNWSEAIPSGDYVRVTFEKPLDKTRDITIYPRIINSSNSSNPKIEVYEFNSSVLITEFTNIIDNEYNKVYLAGLGDNKTQDVFDLRFVSQDNEFLEIDHIIDPASTYNISFVAPTPANGTSQQATNVEINISISNASDLSSIIYNWNNTNYTMYDDSLVLMMNFNNISALGESNTKVVDISKYSNNGTCSGTGCPTWVSSGKYNGAYSFDGVNDVWTIPENDSLDPAEITLSAWIKPYSANYGNFINKGGNNGYRIRIDNFRTITFFNLPTGGAGSVTSINTVPLNNWTYVVATGDSSGLKIYLNGVLDNSGGGSYYANTADDLEIGRESAYNENFNGLIDEVRIYNRSLTASEVNQLYMSNLYKYDTDKWALYVNQTKNSTTGLDEETYTYQAFAQDTSGNLNYTDLRTIIINIHPTINLTSPANGILTTSNTIYFAGNFSDNDGLNNATPYIWNSTGSLINSTETQVVTGTSNSSNVSITLPYDDVFNWNYYACDSLGSCGFSASNYSLTFDTKPPLINFINPTPANGTSQQATNVEINVSIIDISNLDEVIYNWNGTNYTLYNDSLVLMYNFDNRSALGESNTKVVDISKYSNNGTCSGSTCPTFSSSGKYGGAYSFDGVDDIINTGTNGRPTNNFTFGAWIKTSVTHEIDTESTSGGAGTSGQHYAFGATNGGTNAGAGLSVGTNGISVYEHGGGYMPALAVYSAQIGSNWNHIMIVYKNKQPLIYLNGNLVHTGLTSPKSLVYAPIEIGSGSYGALTGTIDEVRIWNRSLTADEVNQLYMSNLYKYDTDKWALYVNQTKNSTTGLDDGTYTYQAFAQDTSGNLNYTDLRTIIINTPPTVNLNSPANGILTTSNTIYFAGNFSDNSGLNNATPYIWNSTGSLINSTETQVVTGTSNSSNVSITLPYDDVFNWNYYACDNTGLCSFSASNYSLTVTPPTINLNSPANATSTTSRTIYFAGNFSDNDGLSNATPYIWNSTGSLINSTETQVVTGTSNSSNVSITLPYNDVFNWNYYACDNTGLCGFSASNYSLTVLAIPNITTIYPNSTNGESFELTNIINLSISEPNNQIFNITYTNDTSSRIQWFVDSIAQSNFENLTEFNWTGNYTQDGSYIILVNVSYPAYPTASDSQSWNLSINNTWLNATINLSQNPTSTDTNINVFGHVNLSTGENVTNTSISLFIDDVVLSVLDADTFSEVQTSDTDFNSGVLSNTNVSGTGNGASVGLSVSSVNPGDYDLLIGGDVGVSYGYENTGNSTNPVWTAKPAWDFASSGYSVRPALADLDNDGDYDSLIGEAFGFSFGYENTGNSTSPTWTAKPAWDAPDVGNEATPALADLDNDGDYDLLIGEYNGVSFGYENTGNSTNPNWTAKSAWNAPDVGDLARPAFADLDNDGDYDLLIGGDVGVSYGYENTGNSTNPVWTAKPAWDFASSGYSVRPALADLDNDGDYDSLIGETFGFSFGYENTGNSTSPNWTKKSAWDAPDVGLYAAPAFADLDNDITIVYFSSGTFTSSVIDTGGGYPDYTTINFSSSIPAGTNLTIQLASNNDNSTWNYLGPDGTSGSFYTSGDIINSTNDGNRYIRYRANFSTSDTSVTPTLYNVTINYGNTQTDSNGNYNYTFTTPSSKANYEIKINLTYSGEYAENNITLMVTNTKPNTPNVYINSTDGTNDTLQDLHCFATILDAEANKMNVSIRWYRNDVLNLTIDYNNSYSSGTAFDGILSHGNTTLGETWNCSMRLFDGLAYRDWVTTGGLEIINSPTFITLNYPANNSFINTSNVSFNFTATDKDEFKNATIYADWSGSWTFNNTNQTPIYSGNQSIINVSGISDGSWIWDVYACDNSNNCTLGSSNYTLTIDTIIPLIDYGIGTEANSTYFSRNWIYVNVSVTEINEDTITFNLYNSTLSIVNSTSYTNSQRFINFTNLNDGIYYYNVAINDSAGNSNTTKTRKITLDTTLPLVDYGVGTEANGTSFNRNWIYVNVSVTEINEDTITFNLYDSALNLLSSSSYTNSNREINWTGMSEGYYYYNVSVNDSAGNINASQLRKITLDTTNPIVTNYSWEIKDNDVGGSAVLFNWTVTDNLDLNLSCYPTYSGSYINSTSVFYVANGTDRSTYWSLPGGYHSAVNVTCFDDANNSHQSSSVYNYLVAIINISSPQSNNIVRPNTLTSFVIDEIDGKEFLNNVSLSIENSTTQLYQNYSQSIVGDQHTISYTWENFSQPFYATVNAWGFNTSVGLTKNATDSRTLVFLRPLGTTINPDLRSACPNLTYNFNNSNIKIDLIADLDTLLKSENLTIIMPDGNNSKLRIIEQLNDSIGFMNYLNYTFNINQTGNYTILASIEDYENQTDSWSYVFYSSAVSKTVILNNTQEVSILDTCDNDLLYNGTDLQITIPSNGLYNINTTIVEPLKNITLMLRGVSLTNQSLVINYTSLSNETSPPSEKSRVYLFDLKTNLTYSNYTITIYYSPIASTLDNESTLKMYKCSNVTNSTTCNSGWLLLNTTLNTTKNTLTSTLTNMSRFIVTEDQPVVTQTITQTVSSGGGGTTTKTIYANIEILVPGQADMERNDEIILPVIVRNPLESVPLNGINLSAIANTQGISVSFDNALIQSLNPGEQESVNMIIKTDKNALLGEYEITVNASSDSPKITDSAKVFMRIVENLGKEFVRERVVLIKDLFKENPECLEFNDYLKEAEKNLDSNPEKAKELVQLAITGCKELITSKNFDVQRVVASLKDNEWKNPVILGLLLLIISFIILIWIFRLRARRRALKKLGFNSIKPSESKSRSKIFGFIRGAFRGVFKKHSRAKKSSGSSIAKKGIFER